MLFDLRGRGRRRTVRIIYTGLALLMGVGLVGFGIGGGFGGGGLLTAAGKNEGSGGTSFASQISKYRKLTQREPNNPAGWEKLTAAQLHEAGGEAYVSNGTITAKGRELFSQTSQSWEHYIGLNPSKPSVELAKEMVRLYGQEGLNQPASAVSVLQIVVAADPTNAAYFASLAENAYRAHNIRVGDLATAKTITLVTPAQRPRVKTELEALKKSVKGESTVPSTGATATTSTGTGTKTSTTGTGTKTTGTAPSSTTKK
jgi:hypothetical protein